MNPKDAPVSDPKADGPEGDTVVDQDPKKSNYLNNPKESPQSPEASNS